MVYRILLVVGTRPEAVKMAPIIKTLKDNEQFEPIVCVTAQHREMLDQVLTWFQIEPDYDLSLMRPDQTLELLTAKVIEAVADIIRKAKPDMMLVQGDTTTAMTSALAGFYAQVPVGHVEAGLRTYNKYNPFPEEVNRQLISVIGSYHFAPTTTAQTALLAEGIPQTSIFITGNTVIDALYWTLKQPYQLNIDIEFENTEQKLILVTAHRRESHGEGLRNICIALKTIVTNHPHVHIVFPVHLNPNVQKVVFQILEGMERVHLLEPLEYPAFAHLMNRCDLVITDSGGLQEEAPALGKPVVVIRETTERPEAVEAGTALLVGTTQSRIIDAVNTLLTDADVYNKMAAGHSPFGDGNAAQRIVDIMSKTLA